MISSAYKNFRLCRYLVCEQKLWIFSKVKKDEGNISISPGIPPASPFCKGGLRGIFLIQPGVIENLQCVKCQRLIPFLLVPSFIFLLDLSALNFEYQYRRAVGVGNNEIRLGFLIPWFIPGPSSWYWWRCCIIWLLFQYAPQCLYDQPVTYFLQELFRWTALMCWYFKKNKYLACYYV